MAPVAYVALDAMTCGARAMEGVKYQLAVTWGIGPGNLDLATVNIGLAGVWAGLGSFRTFPGVLHASIAPHPSIRFHRLILLLDQ